MTAAQLLDARMLIPGAYELNAPPHRATPAARAVPALARQDVSARAAGAEAVHVVAAPPKPTTRLGHASAILGDIAVITAIIFAIPLALGVAVLGVEAAVMFILEMFGRQ
jgi:hypothetical protein